MQAGVGLIVTDVMPIYMIIPRYSHNYCQFHQLLDSNSFTHRNTYAILREATSETYGPWVYFPSYKFPIYNFSLRFTSFAIFYFPIYKPKIPKIFTLSFVQFNLSLLDLAFASNREGIYHPFIALGASCLIVCAGIGDLYVVSYWIDTLVL